MNFQKKSNNLIHILRNQNVIKQISKLSSLYQLTCVDEFDLEKDIFELKTEGSDQVNEFISFF